MYNPDGRWSMAQVLLAFNSHPPAQTAMQPQAAAYLASDLFTCHVTTMPPTIIELKRAMAAERKGKTNELLQFFMMMK